MRRTDTEESFATLLTRAQEGDASAIGPLFGLVYSQLKNLARAQRRQGAGETLNTTALVHEVFLKLRGRERLDVHDEGHFMAVAATAMRQILIDHSRARRTAKRGASQPTVSIDQIQAVLGGASSIDVAAQALVLLDESMVRLAARSDRQYRVAECRIFGGYTIEETARALGISPATVKRDWSMAQAWLYRDLRGALS